MTPGRAWYDRVLPIAVVVLAVLMGGQYVHLLTGVRDQAECASIVRTQLAQASDDNQNGLILGVAKILASGKLTDDLTPAERRARSEVYREMFGAFAVEAERISAERRELLEGKVCG